MSNCPGLQGRWGLPGAGNWTESSRNHWAISTKPSQAVRPGAGAGARKKSTSSTPRVEEIPARRPTSRFSRKVIWVMKAIWLKTRASPSVRHPVPRVVRLHLLLPAAASRAAAHPARNPTANSRKARTQRRLAGAAAAERVRNRETGRPAPVPRVAPRRGVMTSFPSRKTSATAATMISCCGRFAKRP